MVKPRRRSRQGGSHADASSTIIDPDPRSAVIRPVPLLTRVISWVVPGSIGLLAGIGISLAYYPLLATSLKLNQGQSTDNVLLVTQQLDELFNIVDQRLNEGGAELESYRELMNVFCVYDRQFIAINKRTHDNRLATAYAAKRFGHCSLTLGELEAALASYKQSRSILKALSAADPKVLGLYSEWLSVQLQIVFVEIEQGHLQAARDEFFTALRHVDEADADLTVESYRWLSSRIKMLVALGMQLKLYRETAAVAERFTNSTNRLAQRYPADPNLAAQAREANQWLERLRIMIVQERT